MRPTVYLSASAFLALHACAPYPQRVNESPIMINGDRVPSADASTAAPMVAEERDAARASIDSVHALATAGASAAMREAIARGEVTIGMNEVQVYAATRTAPVAWVIRRAGSDAVLVPARVSMSPRDRVGEMVMVQMEAGRAVVLSRRGPQGLLVASRPQDASAQAQGKAAADALVREGDDLVTANDMAGALNRYDRASVLDPENAEVQYKAARLLDLQLRPQEALMRYQRFLLSLDLERIKAQGEANAKMAEAIAMAQQRIVVLEKQVR